MPPPSRLFDPSQNKPTLDESEAMTESKTAFVLMPFRDDLREVYAEIYRPACEANGLKCWRVDEITRPGSITRDIVDGIFDADVIIADLTDRNPNVFYELGIAHAIGNKTIMTSRTGEVLPFDLQAYRVIFFDQTITGAKRLYAELDAAIKALLVALDRTNNPVQDAAASRTAFGRKVRVPLVKAVSLGTYSREVEEYLRNQGMVYTDDLARLDLDEMYSVPGIGKTTMARFVSELLASDAYPDVERLQDFILRHRLSVTRPYRVY